MTDETKSPVDDALIARAGLTTHERELVPESTALVRPSKKRGLIVAGVALGVFAATVAAFGFYQAHATRSASEAAYADLTQCLVGGRPGGADEALLALRRHQVAFMAQGEDARRGNEREPWPERCAAPALRLGDASRAAKPTTDALARALEQHRGLEPSVWPNVRALVELAAAEGWSAKPSAEPGPPEHPRALTIDDLPEGAFITKDFVAMRSVELARWPTDAGTFFVDHRGEFGPFHCKLGTPLRCARVAPTLARTRSLALVGTSDGAPLLRDEAKTLLRADSGGAVDKLDATSAHAFESGLVVAAGVAPDGALVYSIQRKPDGPAVHLDLAEELERLLGDARFDGRAEDVRVAHGRLFVRARVDDRTTLLTFEISADGRPSKRIGGALERVGPLSRSLFVCRAGERVTVLASTYDAWFESADGAAWREVPAPLLEGAACSARGRTGAAFAAVQRCEPECKTTRAPEDPKGDLAPRPGTRAIAPASDGVALIHAAGDLGGVRVLRGDRAAPIDSVLFDDRIAGGAATDLPTIAELRAFAVEDAGSRDAVVVLLATSKGLAALRIQSDGAVQPEAVEWSAR